MTPNPSTILKAYLTSNTESDLYALVADRIYGMSEATKATDRLSKKPAIDFFFPTGSTDKYRQIDRLRVQFRCWSTTEEKSYEIASALKELLHQRQNLKITIGEETYVILGAEQDTSPVVIQDPNQTNLYFALVFYNVSFQMN